MDKCEDLPWGEATRIIDSIQRPEIPKREFVIDKYGLDLTWDVRPAINRAIENADKAGGGRVVVPKGNWRCEGPIHLRSCIELHLREGAYLKFSPEPSLYLPNVLCRWEGVNIYNYSPLIYGRDLSNVAVTGKGVIDGGAEIWRSYRSQQQPAIESLRTAAERGVPVEERQYGEGHFLRPSMIQLLNCQRVFIEGVTFVNAPFWMIHPVYCKHVTIRNISCDSMYVNNDGIDVDSCAEVLIEECVFRNGDDAIVIKAGRDKDAWETGIPTRNVIIRNCDVPEALHRFAVGSEMSGGVENVYIHNCRIGAIKAEAIQFKSNKDRGGYIKNVHVQDIKVEQVGRHLFFFTNNYHSYRGGNAPTSISNITLSDVTCEFATNAIHLQGLPEQPVSNITFHNVEIKRTDCELSSYEHMENITFDHVFANGKPVSPATD